MKNAPQQKLTAIYEELREEILQGRWQVGSKLPNECAFAERFDCSLGTVNKAMSLLAHDGLIEKRTRRGTQVIKNTQQPKMPFASLDALAFIYSSDQHEGMWRTLRGFQQAAHAASRRTLMLSTGTDFRKEAEIVGRLAEFDVKGAALYPVVLNPNDFVHYTQMILSCKFPVVLIELNISGLRRPSVVVDGFHAGYTATKHLVNLGLKTIGFLATYAWTPVVREKYLGYRQALEESKLEEDPKLVSLVPEMHPSFEDPLREPMQVAKSYLEKALPVEGVVCSDDFLAVGLIKTAAQMGVSVPKKLKVVGMEDNSIARLNQIELTTYHVPYESIGKRAFERLERTLKSEDDYSEEQLRGHLVVRKTA